MTIFLSRHAQAQSRHSWQGGDDEGRPLTKRGRRQAEGLVAELGDRPIKRILSSPAVRCLESMTPLAAKAGVEVEPTPELAEGADPAHVMALARALAAEGDHSTDSVLCTHGDVIPDVLRLVSKDGAKFRDELRWAKGSTWALDDDGGRFTKARYLSPREQ